jgi:hypothetical protein
MKTIAGLGKLIGILVSLHSVSYAQSFVELANTFSRTLPAGSARMQAMGGSQTALGGDYSLALSNPAGLGLYNRSEVALSLGYQSFQTQGRYFSGDLISDNNKDSKSQLNLPGISLIFSSPKNGQHGFLQGTFGISYSRLNDFNRNIQYSGTNPNNSLIDFFIERANGRESTQFSEPTSQGGGELFNTLTEMAYNNYLIGESTILNPANDPTQYFTDIDGIPLQSETWETRGAQNQWTFSYGANLNDKLFLGASLGFASIRYESTKRFREDFDSSQPLFFYEAEESIEVSGNGVNLNVGFIYRPLDALQLGMSYITPTSYELSDSYTASIISRWDNFEYTPGTILSQESSSIDPAVIEEYRLKTPGKLNLGAAFFVGTAGVITADVERIDYSGARYKPLGGGLPFDNENDAIKEVYQDVFNVRVGTEFRHQKYRFRGGYTYMPDPFVARQNNQRQDMQAFSAGLGYREKNFFIDVAAVYRCSRSSYRPYSVDRDDSPLLTFRQTATSFMVTLGFPF